MSNTFNFNINVSADLSQKAKDFIMALADDLLAQIADLKSTAQAEHDQVAAAFADLQAQIGQNAGLTSDQLAAVNAAFADAKAAITGVFEPDATPPPAADQPPA